MKNMCSAAWPAPVGGSIVPVADVCPVQGRVDCGDITVDDHSVYLETEAGEGGVPRGNQLLEIAAAEFDVSSADVERVRLERRVDAVDILLRERLLEDGDRHLAPRRRQVVGGAHGHDPQSVDRTGMSDRVTQDRLGYLRNLLVVLSARTLPPV